MTRPVSRCMQHVIAAATLLAFVSAAGGTEAPGNDPTERVIPKTTYAVIGQLVSCVETNEPGDRVLDVEITPIRSLWGDGPTNAVRVKYREFIIPEIPEGIGVSFDNYTGSGIEWDAEPGERYICFLKKDGATFSLLRLEPVANEERVLKLHEEKSRSGVQ